MLILGLNVFHADASAAVVDAESGRLVAAVAEERLNRVKHFAGFPERAIQECLRMAGADLRDVSHIAVARDSKANLLAKLGFALRNLTRMPRLARQRLENRAEVASVPALLAKAFDTSEAAVAPKMRWVEHHLAHLASCFYVSPFEEAALLSIDGFGDFASRMAGIGRGTHIEVLDRTLFPDSLGVLYTAVCQFIGYDQYGDEGKVMGLAPYGEEVFRDFFDELVRLEPGGRFSLNLDYFVHHSEGVDYSFDGDGKPTVAPLYSPRFLERFGQPTPRYGELTQRNKDLARSLQACLERAYLHTLNSLAERTRTRNLGLSGGVALNSVANGLIFEHTPFERVFIQPAAGDDGTALGAAYHVLHHELGRPRGLVMEQAYTGCSFGESEMISALNDAALPFERLPDEKLFAETARDIAAGKVVGWFQGAMEWGPRALGNRSIVAHPGLANMKDVLNARIKHREWFRPFAPSILAERTGEYFEQTHPSPFMLLVYKTRPAVRERICAVNHVDDTGRLQTVAREQNARYYELIRAFERQTGLPVVLNTSFNENEPIVCTPAEAVDCFVRTKMDTLVLGNHLCRRVGHA